MLTFDNLGEASELERGDVGVQTLAGRHPSVTRALPRLLDELGRLGLTATFFVEALNCELYPVAVREIAGRGHELGGHGWRHERWAGLSGHRERELLARSGRAFAALGLSVRAFRPPGGEPTAHTAAVLRESGHTWWSPAGGRPAIEGSLARVPFDWELVDAYHLMERFGALRAQRGDGVSPAPPSAVADRFAAALRSGRGLQTVVLHPFLMLDEQWWAGVRMLLELLFDLASERGVRVGPGGRFASELGRAAR